MVLRRTLGRKRKGVIRRRKRIFHNHLFAVQITRVIKLLRMRGAGAVVRVRMRNKRKRYNFGVQWIDGRKY
jgi:hypothetical protein